MKKKSVQKKRKPLRIKPKKGGIVGRASGGQDLLNMIRDRFMSIPRVVEHLAGTSATVFDASIVIDDEEQGNVYWLLENDAPGIKNQLKLIVDRKLMPKMVGSDIYVPRPKDHHVDLMLGMPTSKHVISIDCGWWKREGAGSKKTVEARKEAV